MDNDLSRDIGAAGGGISSSDRVSGAGRAGAQLRTGLGDRSIVLVGLMGAGKTTIGRRLATRISLPFKDADVEIEKAAGMSVPDIFALYGEGVFRDTERRVIARILGQGPIVLATGGGAFMNAETRQRIRAAGVSVWLKADHETLMRRVRRRSNRPLLQTADPDETMRRLIAERHAVYAEADCMVESIDGSHDRVVGALIETLANHIGGTEPA
jgi:shikimate kinase